MVYVSEYKLLEAMKVGAGRVHHVLEVVVLLVCVMVGRDITSVADSVHEVVT